MQQISHTQCFQLYPCNARRGGAYRDKPFMRIMLFASVDSLAHAVKAAPPNIVPLVISPPFHAISLAPFGFCATNRQAQATEISAPDHTPVGDITVIPDGEKHEDTRENRADNGNHDTVAEYLSAPNGKTDGEARPAVPQEAAVSDGTLSALGDCTSSSTLASVTGKGDDKPTEGKGVVLADGLAVALWGHWRAAELQFEGTARRVRTDLTHVILCFCLGFREDHLL